MDPADVSRDKFKTLVNKFYTECENCQERSEDEVMVLPCIHVVCKSCVLLFIKRAIHATKQPRASQKTKYHDHRRFQCPVCHWPIYKQFDSDDFKNFPNRLPLHADLLAMGDTSPPSVNPYVTIQSDGQNKDRNNYETRQGSYIYESVIGTFGPEHWSGQISHISGMAVDESDPQEPLVVLCENISNVIMTFTLQGRHVHSREVGIKIWDVCIGERGTVIATVAEQTYGLAKWDSGRTPHGGIRYEDIFRDIYGHGALINSEPFGLAMDQQGRFFVTVLSKDRVVRWDERRVGDHASWFGDSGDVGMGFNGPYYIAKMSNGYTVLSCTNSHKVKIIDDESEVMIKEMGSLGDGLPDLCYPHGVCVDSEDNIYIADSGNFRVIVYDKEGEFKSCAVNETWNYGIDVKPTNVAVMKDGRLLVAMQGRMYCKVHVYAPIRTIDDDDDDDDDCSCCTGCWSFFAWCCCSQSSSRSGYSPIN